MKSIFQYSNTPLLQDREVYAPLASAISLFMVHSSEIKKPRVFCALSRRITFVAGILGLIFDNFGYFPSRLLPGADLPQLYIKKAEGVNDKVYGVQDIEVQGFKASRFSQPLASIKFLNLAIRAFYAIKLVKRFRGYGSKVQGAKFLRSGI